MRGASSASLSAELGGEAAAWAAQTAAAQWAGSLWPGCWELAVLEMLQWERYCQAGSFGWGLSWDVIFLAAFLVFTQINCWLEPCIWHPSVCSPRWGYLGAGACRGNGGCCVGVQRTGADHLDQMLHAGGFSAQVLQGKIPSKPCCWGLEWTQRASQWGTSVCSCTPEVEVCATPDVAVSCLETETLKPTVTGVLSHGVLWFPHFKSWFILSKSRGTCLLVSGILIPNLPLWIRAIFLLVCKRILMIWKIAWFY